MSRLPAWAVGVVWTAPDAPVERCPDCLEDLDRHADPFVLQLNTDGSVEARPCVVVS